MDKYIKGKNVEDEITRENLPFEVSLPADALWFRVKGGTHIHQVLEPALQALKDGKLVVWTGSGAATKKTISCAEICKQRCNNKLHQVTKAVFTSCKEHWTPMIEGLDELIVVRKIPCLHIALCMNTVPSIIDVKCNGYQAPGIKEPFIREIREARLSMKHENR